MDPAPLDVAPPGQKPGPLGDVPAVVGWVFGLVVGTVAALNVLAARRGAIVPVPPVTVSGPAAVSLKLAK